MMLPSNFIVAVSFEVAFGSSAPKAEQVSMPDEEIAKSFMPQMYED